MKHTRRLMLALLAPFASKAQQILEPRANRLREPLPENGKWFVTVPAVSNGCFPDAIPVSADSRVEALLKAGITVWSEAEWNDAKTKMGDRLKQSRCVSAMEVVDAR